jgi:hypothetical protein
MTRSLYGDVSELMFSETFVSVFYMKPSVGHGSDFALVKYPEMIGIDLIYNMNVPKKNHLSINRLRVNLK